MRTAPFGSWSSEISAARAAAAGRTPFEVTVHGSTVWWTESRPAEQGRHVVVRRDSSSATEDVTPPGFNARTMVHEYGGGAYLVAPDGTVWFSNFDDQRVYRQDPGAEPVAVTPEPERARSDRYADGVLVGDSIVCVRERHHEGREAINELVVLPSHGGGAPSVIASGRDFYAFPRVSPDGTRLAWTAWDHPRMPWDGSEVWVAEITDDATLTGARAVAGGADESVFQPAWSPDGVLHLISDRSGWWNLYRAAGDSLEPLAPLDADFGQPQWLFGYSRYGFLGDGRIAAAYFREGRDHLAIVADGRVDELDVPHTEINYVRCHGETIFYVGASPLAHAAVIRCDVSGAWEELSEPAGGDVDPRWISVPRPIEYPTAGGATAHALFYPPANPDFVGPAGEQPPVVVHVHGGPTSHRKPVLDYEFQFWTSRGIAVVDVNYGGSTGYGREYRRRLNGTWGIVDTEDAINAAQHLVGAGEIDGSRLTISGGSAGGWTVLCALVFHDVFAAGANYFGVSDLEPFVHDTHKFESRYIQTLVGPWPEAKHVYDERSPVRHAERISAPCIVFQGLEDEVVPPEQSEVIVDALAANGIPHAYIAFEGEQHGFRRAENIIRCLEAELYFYSKVLGFDPADEIEPVDIKGGNLGG